MNIIKLKDVIMPAEMEQAEYFNKHLKGKYAYWVQMRYIVSFDHMRHEGYVACEEDITKLLQREDGTWPRPYGAPALDVYDPKIICYVDEIETDRINNTIEFRLKNKYTPDEDITIEELKNFRTWLASELLLMDQTELGEQKNSYFTEAETHVLRYYAGGMYDSTIKILSEFGGSVSTLNLGTTVSSCGCSHSSDLSNLYNTSLNICEPISIYRKNIYEKMVQMFSNVSFWDRWSQEFILTFKKYIDNIINLNLPINQSILSNVFADCGCSTNDNSQSQAMSILKRLSMSLDYIHSEQISGHKNYINDAFKDWSSILYESMQW